MIALGTIVDGRELIYDAAIYEFKLGRSVVTYDEVVELDRAGHIVWLAPEQRDWLYRINAADLAVCNARARGRLGVEYAALTPEEQVQADAERDDSVLAGKIVEADPSLVQAVAHALEQQGLIGASAVDSHVDGQAAKPDKLPEGMEPLSQVQNQPSRKMTITERYLMQRILKNDDKQKRRREKEEEALEAKAAKASDVEQDVLEEEEDVSKAQRFMHRKEKREERASRRHASKGDAFGAAEVPGKTSSWTVNPDGSPKKRRRSHSKDEKRAVSDFEQQNLIQTR